MKGGLTKGLIAGMVIGSAAAAMFGVANWQTARSLNRKAKSAGSWIASRADDLAGKL